MSIVFLDDPFQDLQSLAGARREDDVSFVIDFIFRAIEKLFDRVLYRWATRCAISDEGFGFLHGGGRNGSVLCLDLRLSDLVGSKNSASTLTRFDSENS